MASKTPLLEEFHNHSKNKTDYGKSKNTVYEILADFTDRRGLRQEWENIDPDIQEEIVQDWINIASRNE